MKGSIKNGNAKSAKAPDTLCFKNLCELCVEPFAFFALEGNNAKNAENKNAKSAKAPDTLCFKNLCELCVEPFADFALKGS